MYDQDYNLYHKFPLREEVSKEWLYPLRVSNDGKVFVLVICHGVSGVDVYETDGKFIRSFGHGILSSRWVGDIATAKGDRVMVLDGESHCVVP